MKILILLLIVSCSQLPHREPSSLQDEVKFWPLEQEGCKSHKDIYLEKTSSTAVTFDKKFNLNCNVQKGRWKDFFTGEAITHSSQAIVTPVIPLGHLYKNSLETMPLIRALGIHQDMDFYIVIKKDSEGEKRFLANIDGPTSVPDQQPGICEFWGMWKDMKEKWNIDLDDQEEKSIKLQVEACFTTKAYDRKAFKHWSTLAGHKCDTRTEMLNKTSLQPAQHLKSADPCSPVLSGNWFDLYTADMITDPKKIDIDHFVPLQNAYISGAWKFPQWKKELYANFQDEPFHLVSVSATQNRSKGAAHPGIYLPPLESYQCDYLKQWIAIKLRWGLRMSINEANSIEEHMMKCGADPKVIRLLQTREQVETDRKSQAE